MLALGALTVAALAFAPPSAQAYYTIESVADPGYCLDSNSAGSVYRYPCSAGNIYQHWERWQGGWTRSRATGRCLQVDAYRNVRTAACNPNQPLQFFQHWNGGWFQRMATPYGPAQCLSSRIDTAYIQAIPCAWDNPWNPDLDNVWRVRPR